MRSIIEVFKRNNGSSSVPSLLEESIESRLDSIEKALADLTDIVKQKTAEEPAEKAVKVKEPAPIQIEMPIKVRRKQRKTSKHRTRHVRELRNRLKAGEFKSAAACVIVELALEKRIHINELGEKYGFSKKYLNQIINAHIRITNRSSEKIFPFVSEHRWLNGDRLKWAQLVAYHNNYVKVMSC